LKAAFPAKFPVALKSCLFLSFNQVDYQAFLLMPKSVICNEYMSCHLMIHTLPAL